MNATSKELEVGESVKSIDLDKMSLSDEQWLEVEKLAVDLAKLGASLGIARGFTDDEMENVYSIAYQFLQQNKLKESEALFRFLCLYGGDEVKYWMGLGITLQTLENYKEALNAYCIVCFLKCDRPEPFFCTAQCLIKTGDYKSAKLSLQQVVELTTDVDEEAKLLIYHTKILNQEIDRITKS